MPLYKGPLQLPLWLPSGNGRCIRSPQSLVFYRRNNPSSQSVFRAQLLQLSEHLHALLSLEPVGRSHVVSALVSSAFHTLPWTKSAARSPHESTLKEQRGFLLYTSLNDKKGELFSLLFCSVQCCGKNLSRLHQMPHKYSVTKMWREMRFTGLLNSYYFLLLKQFSWDICFSCWSSERILLPPSLLSPLHPHADSFQMNTVCYHLI